VPTSLFITLLIFNVKSAFILCPFSLKIDAFHTYDRIELNIVTKEAGGDIEMNKDQLINKIHEDFSEKVYIGKLLDQVEDYIRNYLKVVNQGIEKIRKYLGQEVEIEFDDRNAIAHIRIKESSIHFYRRQDRIDVAILRNGNKQEDQMIVMENVCKSRMYEKPIQEAMDKYINLAFQ
jgi:hypothetical protein